MASSVQLCDYWNEVHSVRAGKTSFSEEEKCNEDSASIEDDELDTSFFESLGMPVNSLTEEEELTEQQVVEDAFMGTLTEKQKEALKRRVHSLNATLRQVRLRNKSSKPDIRNFFISNDASSTGTRSRSATPDSLDSVSPPTTPPDLTSKTWADPYLSRSRGSLDSGNHSLVTVPCYQPSSPSLVTVSSSPPNSTLITVTKYHHHPSSTTTVYNHGGTSIVTVTSLTDEEVPSGMDRQYRDSGTQYSVEDSQPRHDLSLETTPHPCNYSRTYISYEDPASVKISNSHFDPSISRYENDRNACVVDGHIYESPHLINEFKSQGSKRRSEPDAQTEHFFESDRNASKQISVVSINGKNGVVQNSPCNLDLNFSSDHFDNRCNGKHILESSPEEKNIQPSPREFHDKSSHRYVHYPDGRQTSMPRTGSLEGLIEIERTSPVRKNAAIRRQRSYAKEIARDVKLYYTKGAYELPGSIFSDKHHHDVQVLRYQPIGSVCIPRCRDNRPPLIIDPLPSRQITEETSSSESSGGLASPTLSIEDSSHSSGNSSKKPPRDTRPRAPSATDYGFKVLVRNQSEKEVQLPELKLEVGRGGRTRMDWLHEADLSKLKNLALLELEIIFSDQHISHSWKNGRKKKKKEGNDTVFGCSLETLLERDQLCLPDSYFQMAVPHIVSKLVSQLEHRGVQEDGILRVPGNSSKTEVLRSIIDTNFYSCLPQVDEAIRAASHHDLVATLKLFLRSLPEPLLTAAYLPAFHKAHRVQPLEERVVALTMLLLLLPVPHRATLRTLLDLCARVVDFESRNRMSLANVATVMAPNLFPPKPSKEKVKNEHKEQVLEYARSSCELMQMLIKYREVLWTVPNRLLGQIRRQYQASTTNKPISRMLARRNKPSYSHEVESNPRQNCTVMIRSPQFTQQIHHIGLHHSITVQEVLAGIIDVECDRSSGATRVEGRREQQHHHRASCLRHPAPVPTTCLLRGPKHALQTHELYERGGNITLRRLDREALLLAVYQDNTGATFTLQCHHPGGCSD